MDYATYLASAAALAEAEYLGDFDEDYSPGALAQAFADAYCAESGAE